MDDEKSVDVNDVELEEGEEIKELNAIQLLHEQTWEKQVSDKIKELIDTEIVVLRQDFKENSIRNKAGPEAVAGGQAA